MRHALEYKSTRRKRAPRHPRQRFVDADCRQPPGGARRAATVHLRLIRRQLTFRLGTQTPTVATVCRRPRRTHGNADVCSSKQRPGALLRTQETLPRPADSVTILENIASGGESNTASRGTNTRLQEVVWN
jgi:hypothetical protein